MGKNPVTWWEMESKDAKKTVDFFNRVFEWEMTRDPQLGNYHQNLVVNDENDFHGGGIYQADEDKEPSVIIYLKVDDVDSKARQIEQNGGKIVTPPFDVPLLGRLCLFEEPTGQRFGIIKRIWE